MSRLNSSFGKQKILQIQARKTKGDTDTRLLVDNTLPERGYFDTGVETIADAVRASETWATLQLMYNLVLAKGPKTVVELGTNMGFSSSYIGSALKALGEGGHLHTLDASPYKIRYAQQMHAELGLDNVSYTRGLFADTLPGVVAGLSQIDLAFIDGDHHMEATMGYLELLGSKASEGAIFLFDDIVSYSDEMRQAWTAVQRHPSVHSWAEFGDVGWAVIRK